MHSELQARFDQANKVRRSIIKLEEKIKKNKDFNELQIKLKYIEQLKEGIKGAVVSLKKSGDIKLDEIRFESGEVVYIETQPKQNSKFDNKSLERDDPETFRKYSYTPKGVQRVTVK